MSEKNNNSSKKQTIGNLTARQQEILELMQEGKVNKEIARILDISLGTVKQHLVAIFKKLNVQNRTMAVARLAEFKDQSGFSAVFANETLFARRPAIVLSLKMNGRLPRSLKKQFHTCMSEFAFDTQSLFMTHQPGEGDLVFGLKRSSAQDVRTALIAAGHIFKEMSLRAQSHSGQLHSDSLLTGALVAGLINVSQNRFGGWSGETVGSHVLAWGHKLRGSAGEGMLYFDEPVKVVMRAFDLNFDAKEPAQWPLSRIEQLVGWSDEEGTPLVGREQELAYIHDLLDGRFSTLIIEGENGMGKSRLCREASRVATQNDMRFVHVQLVGLGFYCSSVGRFTESWTEMLKLIEVEQPDLIIVDDAHHITPEEKASLTEYLCSKPEKVRVIISGRQPQSYKLDELQGNQYHKLHIERMSDSDISRLVEGQLSVCSRDLLKTVSERSRGIPLFIKELMQQKPGEISLPLLITVASRIDKFRVDWKLLYCLSAHAEPVSMEYLSDLMQDELIYVQAAVERAEALGILSSQSGLVSFRHPLVQDVVCYLFQPSSLSNPSSVSQ